MDEEGALRRAVADVARRLYERRHVSAASGNVSVRCGRAVLVTPSGLCKGGLSPDQVVLVDMEGRCLQDGSSYRPSSELKLHLAAYRARPDAGAVVHAHPPFATAFAAARLPLDEPVLPELAIMVGSVPLAPYATPSTQEVPDSVEPLIARANAVLLANHGLVTVGATLEEAFLRVEYVEHLAEVVWRARALGGAVQLDERELASLRMIQAVAPGQGRPEAADVPLEGEHEALVRRVAREVVARLAAGPSLAPATGPEGEGCAAAGGGGALVCARGGECLACGRCVVENPGSVRAVIAAGATRLGAAAGSKVDDRAIAMVIDHTLLRADATREQVRTLCEEAVRYGFASVCVDPANVAQAAGLVKGSPVKVCTVIGFPLGATTATAKAIEARDAIANGAQEIDMVMNVGSLKSGDDDLVRREIEAVVRAACGRAIVKVILETALLTKQEKVRGCLLAKMAGADFVKTSTGFGPSGATVEDVALMRATVGPDMGVKASGGIRDTETALAMIAAGATRIGASASVAIARGEAGG